LTVRQRRCLNAYVAFLTEHRVAPGIHEVARRAGVSYFGSRYTLQLLRRRGLLPEPPPPPPEWPSPADLRQILAEFGPPPRDFFTDLLSLIQYRLRRRRR
jgi:hypothetical protein